ncbi:MAG: cation diffusion facilitator family transporter [Candidatus Tectomicrobia bacterium]|uniref:Cation diffusion facilitator family transporter n=1 Tax=Tectimicrobiota bacterium TaxID=2528274 RepID=A0A932CR38_UNCTE|nr:cation diffusion facilitator family transporter [Candidatus Tectomicrobia bacterium]
MKSNSSKAIIAAFLANLGIAVAKLVGFIFTGAASMLAEMIHSLADSSNQGLLILGGKLARRTATLDHPFGYGRERYFWSFVVALVIFALGSAFAIYEGIEKLFHPHELESPLWAVGILVVAVVLESFSMWTAVREANHERGEQSWWAFIRHAKVPELPVVLLEDLGALLGLVLALVGVGLAMLTGKARFDALGSLAIGLLLGVIAVVLAIEMRSLLLGEAASLKVLDTLHEVIQAHPSVRRLIHMRTQHIGPEELLVAAKVEFERELTLEGVAAAIDALEDRLRQRVPIARMIYLEPDIYHPGRVTQPVGDLGSSGHR